MIDSQLTKCGCPISGLTWQVSASPRPSYWSIHPAFATLSECLRHTRDSNDTVKLAASLAALTHLGILKPHAKESHVSLLTRLQRDKMPARLIAEATRFLAEAIYKYQRYPTFRAPAHSTSSWSFLHFLEELAPHLIRISESDQGSLQVQARFASPSLSEDKFKAECARKLQSFEKLADELVSFLDKEVPDLSVRIRVGLSGFSALSLEKKTELLDHIQLAHWPQISQDPDISGTMVLLRKMIDKKGQRIRNQTNGLIAQSLEMQMYPPGTGLSILQRMQARAAAKREGVTAK